MGNPTKLAYLCAGAGVGGALALLLAPKRGAQTREGLRLLAERGRDRARESAGNVRELFEHRNDLLQAGKRHLSGAVSAGRDAYRESTAENEYPVSAGSVGLLVLEAAAVFAGYKLACGLRKNVKNMESVAPQLETLLDASRSAVLDGAREVSGIASKVRSILGAFERRVGNE